MTLSVAVGAKAHYTLAPYYMGYSLGFWGLGFRGSFRGISIQYHEYGFKTEAFEGTRAQKIVASTFQRLVDIWDTIPC